MAPKIFESFLIAMALISKSTYVIYRIKKISPIKGYVLHIVLLYQCFNVSVFGTGKLNSIEILQLLSDEMAVEWEGVRGHLNIWMSSRRRFESRLDSRTNEAQTFLYTYIGGAGVAVGFVDSMACIGRTLNDSTVAITGP